MATAAWKGAGLILLALVLVVAGFFTVAFGGLNGYVLFMILGGLFYLAALFSLVVGIRAFARKPKERRKR